MKFVLSHCDLKGYRIVESQEKVATMKIVDSLDEQFLLEELIDNTKPKSGDRHYLIQTPFRYPPLKHGSRFGSRFEPSIFYAGLTLNSALCESAFYSFYFLSRMLKPFEGVIMNHKTSFAVAIQSAYCMDLTADKSLSDKQDYANSQKMGKAMREQAVSVFTYRSARCDDALNIGVFDIDAIVSEKPTAMIEWEIKQTSNKILFFCSSSPDKSVEFSIETFLVNGELPVPSV